MSAKKHYYIRSGDQLTGSPEAPPGTDTDYYQNGLVLATGAATRIFDAYTAHWFGDPDGTRDTWGKTRPTFSHTHRPTEPSRLSHQSALTGVRLAQANQLLRAVLRR